MEQEREVFKVTYADPCMSVICVGTPVAVRYSTARWTHARGPAQLLAFRTIAAAERFLQSRTRPSIVWQATAVGRDLDRCVWTQIRIEDAWDAPATVAEFWRRKGPFRRPHAQSVVLDGVRIRIGPAWPETVACESIRLVSPLAATRRVGGSSRWHE